MIPLKYWTNLNDQMIKNNPIEVSSNDFTAQQSLLFACIVKDMHERTHRCTVHVFTHTKTQGEAVTPMLSFSFQMIHCCQVLNSPENPRPCQSFSALISRLSPPPTSSSRSFCSSFFVLLLFSFHMSACLHTSHSSHLSVKSLLSKQSFSF